MLKTVKFEPPISLFEKELKTKVEDYFKSNKLSPKGDYRVVLKTVVMFTLFALPFILINVMGYSNPLLFFLLWICMAIGMIGLGTGTMHDAIHGSYARKQKVNKVLSFVMFSLGGSILNWKIQHNVLHHTYTNIDGLDDDIHSGSFLRLNPHAKKFAIHRYQHLYAWLLYGFMTLFWVTGKNYFQIARYNKAGLVKAQGINYGFHVFKLILQQIIYYSVFFAIPCFVSNIPFVPLLLGFLLMHFVAGISLGMIFQSAHVVEDTDFPIPNNDKMESSRVLHQLKTTANFAPGNKIITWLFGGLNYQVEHHLFPNICHIHYPKLSAIVNELAYKYKIHYNVYYTFPLAVKSHYQMLKKLGE